MGALTLDKLLIIGIIAMVVFGPERLPQFAEQLARLVKRARAWTTDAKARVGEELGPDFTEEDWKKLDPRQYDPRRIIRDAWYDLDERGSGTAAPSGPAAVGAAPGPRSAAPVTPSTDAEGTGSRPAWATLDAGPTVPGAAPFDSEAT